MDDEDDYGYDDDEEYEDDEDEEVDASSRLGGFASRPSPFASSRPHTPPRPGGSFLSSRLQGSRAEENDEDDEDDITYEDVDD